MTKKNQKEKDKFARMIIARLKHAGESRPIRYSRDEFYLHIGDSGGLNLGNAFRCCNSHNGSQREKYLRKFLRCWIVPQMGIPGCFDDAKMDLLPNLVLRADLETGRLRTQLGNGGYADCPYRVIGERLGLTVVYEWPDCIGWFDEGQLQEWGVTFDEVLAIAQENLVAKANPLFARQQPGLYLSRTGDDYDATRLILVDSIRILPVKGMHVAMPANDYNLIITGTDDESGLAAMATIGAEAVKQPYPIGALAFRLDGDNWVPWLPAPDHPLYETFRGLELDCLGCAYGAQERVLMQIGKGGYPATHCHVRRASGGHSSWAPLLNTGLPTSLPKVEAVGVCQTPGKNIAPEDICMVDWDKMIAILGDTVQKLDICPERYLVTEFPSDAKWEQLKSIAWKIPNAIPSQQGSDQ